MKLKLTAAALHLLGASLLLSLSAGALQAEAVDATAASLVKGTPTYTTPAGKTEKITSGASIPAGSTIETGSGGGTGLQLVPGATTVFGPNTDAIIKNLSYSKSPDGTITRHVSLNLTKGSVFSSLAKKDGNSSFLITTPKGVAAARGTDWSVTVTGTGVIISVVDGVVTFTLPNGTTITVGAGATYDSSTNTVSHLSDADIAAIIAAIEEFGFTLAGGSEAGHLDLYTPGTTINPANISTLPEHSDSGSGTPTPRPTPTPPPET